MLQSKQSRDAVLDLQAVRERKEKEFLTAREFADALNLKENTVRAWCRRRRLTFVRFGGNVRIPASELARLKRQAVVPALPGVAL